MECHLKLLGLLLWVSSLLHGLPRVAPAQTQHVRTTLPTSAVLVKAAAISPNDLQEDQKVTSGLVDVTTPWEVVGACRAMCVEQTLKFPPSDDLCLQTRDCLTCWQLCELLYEDELKWRLACRDKTCTVGCRTACKFSFSSVLMPAVLPWEFASAPTTTEISDSVLRVSWSLPTPRTLPEQVAPRGGETCLVYTLLFRDSTMQHWGKVTATLDHITQVDGLHASFGGLRFLLIASSPTGTVAHGVPPYPALPGPSTRAAIAAPTPPSLDPSLSVRVAATRGGRLEAEVTWLQEPEVGIDPLRWTLTWRRATCNVDSSQVYCPLGAEEMSAKVKSKDAQVMQMMLTSLTFNSEYILSLSLEGASVTAAPIVFHTPVCARVDSTYMTCRSTTVAAVRVQPPLPSQETTHRQPNVGDGTTAMSKMEAQLSPAISQHNSHQDPSALSSLWPSFLLLSVGASISTVVFLLVCFCVYSRWCKPTPAQDIAKALESYSQLQLLGGYPGTPHSSVANLHQLRLQSTTAAHTHSQGIFTEPTTPVHCPTPPSRHSLALTPAPGAQRLVRPHPPTLDLTGSHQSLWPAPAVPATPPPALHTMVTTLDRTQLINAVHMAAQQPPHPGAAIPGVHSPDGLLAVPQIYNSSTPDLTRSRQSLWPALAVPATPPPALNTIGHA